MEVLTKNVLEELATARLREAVSLFDDGHCSGAYYLGGYVVELALKACISASFQPDAIPDKRFVEKIYVHDLKKLVELAGLEAERREKISADRLFAAHWEYIAEWSENTRYKVTGEGTSRSFIEALRDPDHGVFEWIRTHW